MPGGGRDKRTVERKSCSEGEGGTDGWALAFAAEFGVAVAHGGAGPRRVWTRRQSAKVAKNAKDHSLGGAKSSKSVGG